MDENIVRLTVFLRSLFGLVYLNVYQTKSYPYAKCISFEDAISYMGK